MKHFCGKRRAGAIIVVALALMAWSQAAWAQTPFYTIGVDTTCQVFIYSPGVKDGLHLAYLTENNTWQEVGQLCGSDYAQWEARSACIGLRWFMPTMARGDWCSV